LGRELVCNIRTAGSTVAGKVLLESDEIVYRGDVRLRIPLASLKSVSARGGELHLSWPEGAAVLELGEDARKWAHRILHPKSRADKLGIRPGLAISAIALGDGLFLKKLRAVAKRFSDLRPLDASDLIFLGAEKAVELGRIKTVIPSLGSGGALWIVYPKGKQEIREQQVLGAGRQAGLVDVKVVSFSPTHTALRFVRPKSGR